MLTIQFSFVDDLVQQEVSFANEFILLAVVIDGHKHVQLSWMDLQSHLQIIRPTAQEQHRIWRPKRERKKDRAMLLVGARRLVRLRNESNE